MNEPQQIQKEELQKLPYLKKAPKDGRIVFLHPYYDEQAQNWISYTRVENKLQKIDIVKPAISSYFARTKVKGNDLQLPLGTLVAQSMSYQGVTGAWFNIVDMISQFASLLKQYNILTAHRDSDGGIMLRNELGYLLRLIRSYYDQFQKLIKNTAKYLVDIDDKQKSLVKELPDSFADVVLYKEQIASKERLKTKYCLFEPLISFYLREAQQFKMLKDIRDGLAHHGEDTPTIFDLKDGAAIRVTEEPWNEISFCSSDQIRENKLGPLRGLFYTLVKHVLGIRYRFLEAFTERIAVPHSAIDKELSLYFRHPFGKNLILLDDIIEAPWEDA